MQDFLWMSFQDDYRPIIWVQYEKCHFEVIPIDLESKF